MAFAVEGANGQQQTPQFRATKDLIRFDVAVLDENNQPVRGLASSDFEVLENGVPQTISAFAAVDVPEPDRGAAPWTLDAPQDVVTNTTDVRRLVVIVVDDASNAFDAGVFKRVKQVARRVVEELGAGDLTAIVFTADNRRPEDFTTDRARLLAAIDRAGQGWDGSKHPLFSLYSIDTLARAAEYLKEVPEKRKLIILISQGVAGGSAIPALAEAAGMKGMPVQHDAVSASVTRMLQEVQRANVSVHPIDPSVRPLGSGSVDGMMQFGYLLMLAAATGGFVVQSDDLDGGIERIFRATASYYLLGYTSSFGAESMLRRTEVRVKRPGVKVVSRKAYEPAKPSGDTGVSPLAEAVAGIIPTNDLPLRLNVIPVLRSNGSESTSALAVVVGVEAPVVSERPAREFDFKIGLFDPEGRPRGEKTEHGVVILPTDVQTARFELIGTIDVPKPGQYSVRVAVHDRARDLAASVYGMVDVADFARAAMSMSGFAVRVERELPRATAVGIHELLPVLPTAVREFARDDRVVVAGHVYQDRAVTPRAVTGAVRIVNARNKTVFSRDVVFSPEQFEARRGAEWRIDLPLAMLEPGAYLLTLEARAKMGTSFARQMRFQVHDDFERRPAIHCP